MEQLDLRLYAIIDPENAGGHDLLDLARAVAASGATLDRAGRVQLPREMTRRLGMRIRVELQEEPDHIGVWPDQAADQERE